MDDVYGLQGGNGTNIPLVQAPGEDSDGDDFGTRNYRPYNRGNKLKRLLEQPHSLPSKPTLWPIHQMDEEYEYVHVGHKRAIVRKGHRRSMLGPESLQEDDPYAEIKMEEIWALPDKPSDLRSMEPVLHTLRSRHLQSLSREAMQFVEDDGPMYRTLMQFTDLLRGEDPAAQDVVIGGGSEAEEALVAGLQDDAEELLSCINETMERLQETRRRIVQAVLSKQSLVSHLEQADAHPQGDDAQYA
ncbi:hypothetical protein BC831DRAFT_479491 [Entophlyctis helioformis]|nr:hypothetical protein BC831DRAFT_479491 [Entophlyctis helioformis]